MICRPRSEHDRDSGAALVLAIGFVVMISAISAGLAALATSSINNRNSLELVRDQQYAADGAIEQAIVQVSTATCDTVPTPIVFSGENLNDVAITVDWVNACLPMSDSGGKSYLQRNVVFSACAGVVSTCSEASVIIRAQVTFARTSETTTKASVQSWSVNR